MGKLRITQEEFINRISKISPSLSVLGEYQGTSKKIFVKCRNCGLERDVNAGSLLNGVKCPNCSGVQKKTNEQFVKELKLLFPNIIPLDKYNGAGREINCRCTLCGNVWKTKPNWLLSKHGCPSCSNKKRGMKIRISNEQFLERIKNINPSIIPQEKYVKSSQRIKCLCSVCGYEWNPTGNYLLAGGGCTKCRRIYQSSFAEQAVFFYIKKIFPDSLNGYREIFQKNEIDIFLPAQKIGIEYDGRHWHRSSINKEKVKYAQCQEKGIKLIRIREDSLIDENLNEICDEYIISSYDGRTYKGLTNCIKELFVLLKRECDVNVERDYLEIQEIYYVNRKEQSLSNRFPEIAKEWHPVKNGKITPEMVLPGTSNKYYWICSKCGYEWEAAVSSRTNKHHRNGCPNCAGRKRKTNDEFVIELKQVNPDIILEEKYKNSNTKLKCRCKVCEHTWEALPSGLLKGKGCSQCAIQRAKKNKESFYAELYEKREDIECLSEFINNNTRIKFRCKICGYEWEAFPKSVLGRKRCRRCAGTLKKTNEDFVEELKLIHPELEALSEYTSANKKIKCKCIACGYVWDVKPHVLKRGSGCPFCNSSQKTNEQFISELSNLNENIKPLEEYTGIFNEIKFRCKKCNNEWNAKPSNIKRSPRCPYCEKRVGGLKKKRKE